MTTKLRDPEEIKAALRKLHHERGQMTEQLTSDERTVKGVPLKIKELSENIDLLESQLKRLEKSASTQAG